MDSFSVPQRITGNTGNTQGASMLRIPAIKDAINNNITRCIYIKWYDHTMYLYILNNQKKHSHNRWEMLVFDWYLTIWEVFNWSYNMQILLI